MLHSTHNLSPNTLFYNFNAVGESILDLSTNINRKIKEGYDCLFEVLNVLLYL